MSRRWLRPLVMAVSYFLLVLLATYLFYRRFPNAFHEPNFYAEDGSVFTDSIIRHGFISSILTTFNGYYIWGIYIVTGIGFIFNSLFWHSQFVTLPQSLALASYFFLGFTATLPVLLFHKYLKPTVLALMCVLSIYVPLLGYDYAIIGTVGNLKFAFLYIAFLLLVYRNIIPEKSKAFYLVDLALVACAYTNATVYLMVPFALLRYVRGNPCNKEFLRGLIRTRSFQSLIGLGILLLPQLYVVHRDGVPPLPGYLDSPYQPSKTVEIFIARSFLFPVVFPFYKHVGDAWAIILMIAFLAIGWMALKRRRLYFAFGIYSILMGTLLFVIKRTGVSALFTGYTQSGPDQFFYAQNLIFVFIVAVIFGRLVSKIRRPYARAGMYLVALLLAAFVLAPNAGSYGSANFMAQNVGTIYADAHAACTANQRKNVTLPIYPASGINYPSIPRQTLCTPDVLAYQPPEVSLGLTPDNNNYLQLNAGKSFTQTFVSPRTQLNGLTIYFSTFGSHIHSPYDLIIYKSDCTTELRHVSLPVRSLSDNSYRIITFDPLDTVKDATLCFTIKPRNGIKSEALAVQLSAPDVYLPGDATINGKQDHRDIVFRLHYKEVK